MAEGVFLSGLELDEWGSPTAGYIVDAAGNRLVDLVALHKIQRDAGADLGVPGQAPPEAIEDAAPPEPPRAVLVGDEVAEPEPGSAGTKPAPGDTGSPDDPAPLVSPLT